MNTPTTPYEATVLALSLALTAQTENQVDECVKIAASFGLSKDEMKRAKDEAYVESISASLVEIRSKMND